MARLIPIVFRPHEAGSVLAEAELCAAALDGDLYRIGPAYAPTDLPPLSAARAAAFGAGLPDRAALDLDTAAWVHGTRRHPPPVPTACIDAQRRARPHRLSAHRIREVTRFEEGTRELGGVLVTTPLRTALDLLRFAGMEEPSRRASVRLLVGLAGGAGAVREALAGSARLPFKERARARLDRLCA